MADPETVTLKEHFEARIAALEKATILAAAQMEKRLDGMNEFRAQLKEQEATFATKDQLDVIMSDIRVLREAKAALEGKASQSSVSVAMLISTIGLAIGVLSLILKK